jgi:P27 family predicted phage terminase small subunit
MQGRKKQAMVSTGECRQAGRTWGQLPDPPTWMTAGAADRFREIVSQLDEIGALAVTDLGLCERYACTYDRWRKAEQALAESAEDIHYTRLLNRAGQPASAVAVPALAQLNKCSDQLAKMEAALGLTPCDRSRLPATRPAGPLDPMEELLQEQFDP